MAGRPIDPTEYAPTKADIRFVSNDSSLQDIGQRTFFPLISTIPNLGSGFPHSEPAGTTAHINAGFTNYAFSESRQESYPNFESRFPYSEPVGTTAQINAGFTDCTFPESLQESHPNFDSRFSYSESNETTLQINAGFTNYTFSESRQEPHPNLDSNSEPVGTTGQLNAWLTNYTFPPDPYLDFNDTSLGEKINLEPSSNSPTIPSHPIYEPVYPNYPPPSSKESQNSWEAPRRTLKYPSGRFNKRLQNIQKFDPTKFYDRLPEAPQSWKRGLYTFQYNTFGELTTKLSQEKMKTFLTEHPLGEKLTLWVQTVPVDSYNRYPSVWSNKCRFARCPDRNNSIRPGFFRVAIDEHHYSDIRVNPYHCAGFVHLFCLEKFLDFPDLCKRINVQPDNRRLPEPMNKMALTRNYVQLLEIANAFIKSSERGKSGDYKETLGYKLTEMILKIEPPSRTLARLKRGGNNLSHHRGDLEVFEDSKGEKKYCRHPLISRDSRQTGEDN